jgi:V-type H+-transporting ATPase subunit E
VRQIQQMVNFILNEAKDKAEEIDAKTLEEFNIERLRYAQQMKDKIRGEFAKKKKTADTQRAIARSTAINKARLMKIEARQQYFGQLKALCSRELKEFSKSRDKYPSLCVDLMIQGCLKLMEDNITVRCRQEDEAVIRGVLDAASRKFTDVVKRQTGIAKQVKLTMDKTFLDSATCSGGVVLLCQDNSIRVDNTLDTRLNLVMQADLPKLRSIVFGKN